MVLHVIEVASGYLAGRIIASLVIHVDLILRLRAETHVAGDGSGRHRRDDT
jgi:hypothetical protein